MEKCASTLQISQSQYVEDSINAFKLLAATAKKTTKSLTCRFGAKDIHFVEWTILGDVKQVTACPLEKNAKEQRKVMATTGPAMRCVLKKSEHCIGDESSASAYIYTYAYAHAHTHAWN